MNITFELQDDKHIKILNEKREQIGEIFTPGGSGERWNNSIQICGFEEAFDLWGCACYEKPSYDTKKTKYITNNKGEKIYEFVKDINLQFGLESRKTSEHDWHYKTWENCHKCFNGPCTCEVQIKHENPFTVKCANDLYLEAHLQEQLKIQKERKENECPCCRSTDIRYFTPEDFVKNSQVGNTQNSICNKCGQQFVRT